MAYWLLKSEPSVFSVDDLQAKPAQTDAWEGVRNYQARNFLRDKIQVGDLAFFYHSSCAQPGIVGVIEIVKSGYPDSSAWDPHSAYYDPKSTPQAPRWYCVDVKLYEKAHHLISLAWLKQQPELQDMLLLRKGNRLSVLPVTEKQWKRIDALIRRCE